MGRTGVVGHKEAGSYRSNEAHYVHVYSWCQNSGCDPTNEERVGACGRHTSSACTRFGARKMGVRPDKPHNESWRLSDSGSLQL